MHLTDPFTLNVLGSARQL